MEWNCSTGSDSNDWWIFSLFHGETAQLCFEFGDFMSESMIFFDGRVI